MKTLIIADLARTEQLDRSAMLIGAAQHQSRCETSEKKPFSMRLNGFARGGRG